jgi:hypothetical protein
MCNVLPGPSVTKKTKTNVDRLKTKPKTNKKSGSSIPIMYFLNRNQCTRDDKNRIIKYRGSCEKYFNQNRCGAISAPHY